MKKDKRMVEFTSQIHKFMNQTVLALDLVDKRLGKLENILFALLSDLGKSEDVNCANCGKDVIRPVIEGLARESDCPNCTESLAADKQIEVEDWDNSSV